MGLEDILKAMEEEAKAEMADILAEAEAAAKEILAEAEARARQARQRHRQEVLPGAAAEEARILNEARLEALKVVMQTREDLIDQAFQAARQELSAMRSLPEYPEVLRRWTGEVYEELGEDLAVSVGAEDLELARSMLAEMGMNARVASNLDSAGGLVATSKDGRILVVNTVDSRLENARQLLRREVAQIILEKDADGDRL